MSEPVPDSQECKLRAIDALSKIESSQEGNDLTAAALLIGIAQVWATLATVPDVERNADGTPVYSPQARARDRFLSEAEQSRKPPNGPGMAGWRSGGGAGQWNG